MQRLRITALGTNGDDELRRLALIRRDLYAHSPIEIDPDNPAYRSQRNGDGRAFFEFSTDYLDAVERVLIERNHHAFIKLEPASGPAGEPCLRCGHIEGGPVPAVCLKCGFEDIAPCPHCHTPVPRAKYEKVKVAGDLFKCPACNARVRLSFNDPLLKADGQYNEPVVVVELATGELV